MVQLLRLFRDLVNEGIFDIIADILQSQDKKLVLTGTDILILFLNQDPNLLRCYVARQDGVLLFGLLVKGMLTDFGDDMHCQFLEILCSLLDSFTSGSQRDTIIDVFYEKHMGQLIDVLTLSCSPSSTPQSVHSSAGSGECFGTQTSAKPEILLNICDLLCFCVLHHPYRIKCSFLLNNVIEKVLFLTLRREKYLAVAAVRFVRTLISRNDEHPMNHIAKNNLLKPIVDAFMVNGDRYNLLNSAVLELFEYIQKENLKVLLKYLIDSFWDQLVKFEKFPSIHALKVKYEQFQESLRTKRTANISDHRKGNNDHVLEKEEDYFNDSEKEDSAAASASTTKRIQTRRIFSNGSIDIHPSQRSCGLVDYDDDEDDKDYKDPHRKQSSVSVDETLESFKLKRKLEPKEESEPVKKQHLSKPSKSKDIVFTALCTSLSPAVLPSKKIEAAVHLVPHLEPNESSKKGGDEEKGTVSGVKNNSSDENHSREEADAPCKCPDNLHNSSENRQRGGDDHLLISSKTSTEMAVNGS